MTTTTAPPSVAAQRRCPAERESRATRTQRLLERLVDAPADDRERLLDELVRSNMGVADALAARYASRGVALEDLRQVAYLALVRSARKFDPEVGQSFLAYCVPTIRGELRRHFRDQGWMVRPPRRIQELQQRLTRAQSELSFELGRSPRPKELAAHLGEKLENVIEALAAEGCFTPVSLDRPVGAEEAATLGDLLEGDLAHGLGSAEARLLLAGPVRRLGSRDRRILMLRFFRGWTQEEIAADIGVTQMQVSRLLTRILTRLRRELSVTTPYAS